MTIIFSCVGQSLMRVDTDVIAANSLKFLTAHFDLDEEWEGLAVTACFTYKNESYHILVDNGECTVPWAVIKAGEFRVSLIGIEGKKDDPIIRATSTEVRVRVEAGPEIENVSNAEEPTLTVVEQLTAAVNRAVETAEKAVETAEDVRDDAESGEFDGEDGKSAYQIAVDNGFEGTEEEWLESLGGVDENAVNEIIKAYLEDNEITGEVDPEKIKEIVEDYLAENPPKGSVDTDKVNELIAEALKKYTPNIEEKDPTVPDWAKAKTKPPYTADEVGAEPVGTVSEHNNATNAHSDLRRDVVSAKNGLSAHNVSEDSHSDIRNLIAGLTTRLNTIANSGDVDLDQLAELVAYIKSNRTLIEAITTDKVSVSDIVNDLVTNVSNKPLSAAQGVALKALIASIKVPTKLSELSGDSTHRTVTDAEKSAWNAKSNFSGSYNDLTNKPTIPTVPTKISAFTNDKGYITDYTETDPTVPSHVKNITSADISKWNNKSNFSGSYNDLTNKPTIPTVPSNVSSFNNDVGYIKNAELNSAVDTALANEKGNIVQQIITELQGLPVFGVVDEDKTITVTSQLTDGTYTLKYENADGTTTDIGTIIIGTGGGSGSEPVITGITAKYTGGNVTEGAAVTSLSGITVTATYSDGSTQTVTGYTLSGTINVGSNTITVSYEGFTTTFTVTGTAKEVAPDTTLTWSIGTKIDSSTGKESTSGSYAASNYISIVDGYTYTLTKNNLASASAKVCYYDANKTFKGTSDEITSQGTATESKTIPIIAGASYFRVRLYQEAVNAEKAAKITLTATKA